MAKKKAKKTSAAEGKQTADGRGNETRRIDKLFTSMQEKGAAWYGREREGIALIEGFQSALLAVRDAQAAAVKEEEGTRTKQQGGAATLAGLAGNAEMDPWLAEDLYQQVQELSEGFQELLDDMYALQAQARNFVSSVDDEEQQVDAMELRPVDYLQMMSQELAAFEAEYQHVEALLRLISFETSTDELRTLVISWSTSPFLDPAQSRSFLQCHQLSLQLHT